MSDTLTPLPGVPWLGPEADDMTDRLRANLPTFDDMAIALGNPTGLWRASTVPDDWSETDGWANEGTAGSALDLNVATDGELIGEVVDGVGTVVEEGHLVAPVLVEGGFEIGFNSGDADDGENDFGFYGVFAMDLSGPFAVTLDYTPDAIEVTSMRYLRRGFPFGHPGFVIEDTSSGGGFVAGAIDGDNFSFTPPFDVTGAALWNGTAIAGRQQFTMLYDGEAFSIYRNGVLQDPTPGFPPSLTFPPFDDASVDLPLIVGPGQTSHNLAFHVGDEVLALDVPYVHSVFSAL